MTDIIRPMHTTMRWPERVEEICIKKLFVYSIQNIWENIVGENCGSFYSENFEHFILLIGWLLCALQKCVH